MNKVRFFKSNGRIFKSVETSDSMVGYIFDESRKVWIPTSGGALVASMNLEGVEIDDPGLPDTTVEE